MGMLREREREGGREEGGRDSKREILLMEESLLI